MSDTVRLEPRALELAGSLRGLGYSPEAAIADLIDNSITAGASTVRISFLWDATSPAVAILDDGHGMSDVELVEAMRLGSDTARVRAEGDLGRFGLGLKTASLGQGKRLTVCSKHAGGNIVNACWDLDHINKTGDWVLLLNVGNSPQNFIDELDVQNSGTLVIWQHLDKMLSGVTSVDVFLEIADRVSKHLGMIFHRHIDSGRLKITINDAVVGSWDPFLSSHPECAQGSPETISDAEISKSILFTGYVLPPTAKLRETDVAMGAGPQGWLAQQGFYLYRADRLIVSGGWLGLGRGDRPWQLERKHTLARISLDITNAADLDWSLDVKKSTAVPPIIFRDRLLVLAREIRRRSESTYRAFTRSANKTSDQAGDVVPIWLETGSGAGTQFRLNRKHPLLLDVRKAIGTPAKLRVFLDAIDRYMPIAPAAAGTPFAAALIREREEADIRKLVRTLYYSLRRAKG